MAANIQVIEKSITDFIKDLNEDLSAKAKIGVDKAADYMVEQLANATPVDTGNTKSRWSRTSKYNKVSYISNNSVNKAGVPIVNLLEFAKKGKPFMRAVINANQGKILEIIKKEV